jgi:hypothetical protein
MTDANEQAHDSLGGQSATPRQGSCVSAPLNPPANYRYDFEFRNG